MYSTASSTIQVERAVKGRILVEFVPSIIFTKKQSCFNDRANQYSNLSFISRIVRANDSARAFGVDAVQRLYNVELGHRRVYFNEQFNYLCAVVDGSH